MLMEGSMYLAKDGKLVSLLRMQMTDCDPSCGKAMLLEIKPDDPEAAPVFDRVIDMPTGANSKTYVLYDEVSGQYVGIGNLCVDPKDPGQRNVLALSASRDGYDWRLVKILLDYRELSSAKVGFQYVTFIIDGEDLLYLSRTSINQSRNYHDANYQTFHRIADFRSLL